MVHLAGDNFRESLKRKKHALVMFYAPCKSLGRSPRGEGWGEGSPRDLGSRTPTLGHFCCEQGSSFIPG